MNQKTKILVCIDKLYQTIDQYHRLGWNFSHKEHHPCYSKKFWLHFIKFTSSFQQELPPTLPLPTYYSAQDLDFDSARYLHLREQAGLNNKWESACLKAYKKAGYHPYEGF